MRHESVSHNKGCIRSGLFDITVWSRWARVEDCSSHVSEGLCKGSGFEGEGVDTWCCEGGLWHVDRVLFKEKCWSGACLFPRLLLPHVAREHNVATKTYAYPHTGQKSNVMRGYHPCNSKFCQESSLYRKNLYCSLEYTARTDLSFLHFFPFQGLGFDSFIRIIFCRLSLYSALRPC
jgi:hypothetical protein